MAKNDDETKQKLEHLNKVIGIKEEKEKRTLTKTSFTTSEVLFLVIITAVVGLIMGSVVTTKFSSSSYEKVDSNLQEFIDNYEYIVNNYSGDIDKEKLLDAALEGMIDTLDQNSVYLEESSSNNFNITLEGSYQGLGISVYNDKNGNIVIYKVFDGSPAKKAGLKKDDIITKFNGEDVTNMSSSKLVTKVKNSKGKIKITYKRNDKEKTVTMNVGNVNLESITSKTYNKNNKLVGYIGVSIFANNTASQFSKALNKLEEENIDSLIIDLRSNSGGHLSSAEKMISKFLDNSHVIYQIQKDKKVTKYYSTGKETKKYKIVIITDSNSASASEVMTSALKEQYGATIVGEKTYGKGTVQELQTLSNGDKYKVTTKNWLTSKGTWVDGKGIQPDIQISLDQKYEDNPTEENDDQLQRAILEATK